MPIFSFFGTKMAELSKKHTERLEEIKENIEKSYTFFEKNYKNFGMYKDFIYKSNIDDETAITLGKLGKPTIEFNGVETYLSRQLGEFSKQQPSMNVAQDPMITSKPPPDIDKIIEYTEGYMRYIMDDANNSQFSNAIYDNMLSGGFDVAKVITDYVSHDSLDVGIKLKRVYDPTLCGFDPMANLSSKSDGEYCFELVPVTKKKLKILYPDVDIDKISFSNSSDRFQWSYTSQREEIVLICDYYEKKYKKTKIVKMATGQTIKSDEHDRFIEDWGKSGRIESAPGIIASRFTSSPTICRYRLIGDQILDYTVTDYSFFPLVFFSNNSKRFKSKNKELVEITRPYFYQAIGAQKLKNFVGQTLANEVENMVQHKWIVARESIPSEKAYKEAYENVQKADVLVHNQFSEIDPDKRIERPQAVTRPAFPQELLALFTSLNQEIQSTLGSYDAQLGVSNQQLSGTAIVEAATQSNATAMPAIVGYLDGLNQVAQIILDLIPKVHDTERMLPVVNKSGKNDYVKVNQKDYNGNNTGVSLTNSTNILKVKVTAGVNFAIQKARQLQIVLSFMKESPTFAQYIDQAGMPLLLKNIEVTGIDEITNGYEQYLQQQQQQQQQQGQQPSADEMKQQNETQKIQLQQQQMQQDGQIKTEELALEKESIDNDRLKIIGDMGAQKEQANVQLVKAQTERTTQAVKAAISGAEMHQKERMHDNALAANLITKKGGGSNEEI